MAVRFSFVILLASVGFASLSASAQQEKLRAFTLCRNGDIVRTIRVEPAGDQFICVYTKNGVDREVGRGIHEPSIRKILENIQGNLVKAGWNCKEATQSTLIEGAN